MNESTLKVIKYAHGHHRDLLKAAEQHRLASQARPALRVLLASWLNKLAYRLAPEVQQRLAVVEQQEALVKPTLEGC